jgi:hypothetical protein
MQQLTDQSNLHRRENVDGIPVSIIDKKNHHLSYNVSIKQSDNTSSPDDDSYFSLNCLLNKRRGQRNDDSYLSRRVREFYKEQDALIDDYERVYNGRSEKLDKQAQSLKQQTKILTNVSLGVNIVRILWVEYRPKKLLFIDFICTKNRSSCSFKISFSCFICD